MTVPPRRVALAVLSARHTVAVFPPPLRIPGTPAAGADALLTVSLRVLSRSSRPGASDGPTGLAGHDLEASLGRSSAYLRRAAANAAVDLLRRRAVQAATAYDDEAPHARVESVPLLKEQLRRAITTLDPDDASLFLLRHVEGLSNQELADVFQLEKNNVAVRLHRIRLRLQAEMEL
jgi:hypothetical protein